MKQSFISLYFFLVCSLAAHAEGQNKYLYVMGGTGDTQGSQTMFDQSIENLADFANQKKWETKISFDGGHAETEKIISDKFPKKAVVGPFAQINFDKTIDDIVEKIENASVSDKKQIMIVVDSHGIVRMDNETSHSIGVASSPESAGGIAFLPVSLDTLKPIIEKAKEKNVKVAIFDGSCYSGATQDLANDNTCVISSASVDLPAYSFRDNIQARKEGKSSFSGNFFEYIKTGKNLEEVYLQARRESALPDFPMISTAAGKAANSKLAALTDSYMRFDGIPDMPSFSQQYAGDDFEKVKCATRDNFHKMESTLDEIGRAFQAGQLGSAIAEAKTALKEYRDFQIQYESAHEKTQGIESKFNDMISKENGDLFKDKMGLAAIGANYDKAIQFYQKSYEKLADEDEKKFYKETIDSIKKQKAIVDGFTQKLSPEEKSALSHYQKKLKEAAEKTYPLATHLSIKLRKVYDQFYLAEANSAGAKNPCRDFVL